MPYKDPAKHAEAQRRYEKKKKSQGLDRHKCWTGIFYPDSAPAGWEDELSEMHVKIWVSPLHDSDQWSEADERQNSQHKAGTLKKGHFHFVVEYDVQVDRETLLCDFGFLNGSAVVKAVRSLRSMVRYLAHLDDPQKAQYDRNSILTFGGADLDLVDQLGTHERRLMLRAMRAYIREHNVVDFCDFYDYCDECEEAWAGLLDDNSSYTIERYIKSRRGKLQQLQGGHRVQVDPFTGEVLN